MGYFGLLTCPGQALRWLDFNEYLTYAYALQNE